MTNAESCKKYYEAHKQERLEYQKKYRETHKAEIELRKKRYNATHREQINEYWREYNKKHKAEKQERVKKYKEKYPEKIKARYTLNNALKRGELERKPCEICGGKAEAHHDNYDEPLAVKWLCPKCHAKYHKSMGFTAKPYKKGD